MPKQEKNIYSENLSHLSEGHALWLKELSDDLRPGTCGYFSGTGRWVPLVHLTDPDSVKAFGKTIDPPDNIGVKSDHGNTAWSQRKTNTVRRVAVSLDGKALPPGSPVSAKAGVLFTNESSEGAILLAHPPVTTDWLTNPKSVLDWVEDNKSAILSKVEKNCLKKRGFWVVKETCRAALCGKSVIQGKNRSVDFHVGANVPNVASATASLQWWASVDTDSGWTIHGDRPKIDPQTGQLRITDGTIVGTEDAESSGLPAAQVVMLFGGYWWKPEGWYSKEYVLEDEKEKQSHLGDDDDDHCIWAPEKDPEEGDGYLKFVPGTVGTDNHHAEGTFGALPNYDGSHGLYEPFDADD